MSFFLKGMSCPPVYSSYLALVVVLAVLAYHLSPLVEGAYCKCISVKEGIYDVRFAEPISPGYLRSAKMSVKVMYDDIYKG